MSTPSEPVERDPGAEQPASGDPAPREPGRRTVVRRPSRELTAEERRFLDRFGQDRPPHHDSSWG
ncbi:hypothetical protein [Cumulibacter manganitolerans]|uniref:hypothetical protein n=1 Tax=Cumulibacter manganitolerans TaxID=1884992 RepID=UPI001296861B|nr:hypothetical protein [Cumulibacter manganitolerans]